MKKIFIFIMFLSVVLLFTSCAKSNPHARDYITNDAYGFWGGLWHGYILPLDWIFSLFFDDVTIYAYNNTGGWYNFGFVLGAGLLGSVINSITEE